MMKGLALFLALALCVGVSAQTNIAIGTTVIQSGVKQIGVNLGEQQYYDSLQLEKNLINRNPGMNPTMYQSISRCVAGSNANTCVDGDGSSGWISGFWPSGSPVTVITGTCTGFSTTVSSFSGPTGGHGGTFNLASSCPAGTIASGDYLTVKVVVPGTTTLLANSWPSTTGNGSLTAESSDLPPAPSQSVQALKMTAPTSADSATYSAKFDTSAGYSFVRLNGTYLLSYWAKAPSGSGAIAVEVDRNGTFYYPSTVQALTGTWTHYTQTFTANETSFPCSAGAVCIAEANWATNGATTVYLDNISLTQCSTLQTGGCVTDTNTTAFRDEVVTALQNLHPGTLRYWGFQLGDTLDNMIADQTGRMPNNYSDYPLVASPYSYNDADYGLTDFLVLCQYLNVEAYIVVPITTSSAEASNWIDYLSGGSGTVYGAKRIAQGYSTPWTTALPKIHLEFGNESWNGTFNGGNISYPAPYGIRAQAIFGAMKANSNYVSAKMDLVLNAQFAGAGSLQTLQSNCNNNDSVEVGPYMMNYATTWTSTANIWQPPFAETQAFYGTCSPNTTDCYIRGEDQYSVNMLGASGTTTYYGGSMTLDLMAEQYATNGGKPMNVYEENFGTGQSGALSNTQSEIDGYTAALGAGLATVQEELTNIQNGILTQNVFQIGQYGDYLSGVNSRLWGITFDMGGSHNLKRPQYLATAAANQGIFYGGTMLQTTQSGVNPTFNVFSTNSVNYTGANTIHSYAFANSAGTSHSLIMVNDDVTNSQAVTFSGTNAPTGAVSVMELYSANLSDTNENGTANVATTTSSLSSPTGMTLDPHSLVVLTWGGSSSPTPTLNVTCSSCLPPLIPAGGSIVFTPVNYYIPSWSAAATTWTVSSAVGATVTNNSDGTGTVHLPSGVAFSGQLISVTATNGSYVSSPYSIWTKGTKTALNAFPLPATNPGINFSPSSVNFGNENSGSSTSPTNIIVTDPGTGALTISSVSITGANSNQYSETTNCALVTTSGSCNIYVTFSPTSTGTKTASVAVTSNAPSSPQMISLSGVGTTSGGGIGTVAGPILSTPSYDNNLAFGTTTGTAERIAFYNGATTSDASVNPFTITSISITGTNAADFVLNSSDCNVSNDSSNPFLTYAEGHGCNIYVTFTPLSGSSGTSKVATFNFVGSNTTVPSSVNITATVP